jgi:hypothetical protein
MLAWMNIESTIVLFVVVAALGLVTVVAADIVLTAHEAEAQKSKNCPRPSQFGPGFNNTQKHCIP